MINGHKAEFHCKYECYLFLFREIAQRHPGNKKTVYYRTPCNKRLVSKLTTSSLRTAHVRD